MISVSVMEPTVKTDKAEKRELRQRPVVLLAERDDAVREVTARALELTGHFRVVEVACVQEALEQLATIAFAAVLLDPKLEGMEDTGATARLYLIADAAGCPVIAFSDIPQVDLGLAYPYGFAGVVTKPFGAMGLGEQVNEIRAAFGIESDG